MGQTASPDLISFLYLKALDVFGEHLNQMMHIVPKEATVLFYICLYLQSPPVPRAWQSNCQPLLKQPPKPNVGQLINYVVMKLILELLL